MGSVDELLAGLLASERRTEELIAALLDETACEESSDDEDEAEEMRILQDVYDKVCKMEARLCVVAARLEEVAAAELQQQLVGVLAPFQCEIEAPRIKIEVATTAAAAAAAATMFERAVTAGLTAAAVVWWGDSDGKVLVAKGVAWHRDWMREWEAMVRWCGGGWLR